jgi:capsular exopolysaccharide synthesis family protein
MSKFFNDTRIAGTTETQADVLPVNMEAAAGALKQQIRTNGSAGASNGSDVSRLLTSIGESQDLVAELAAQRLADCATIRLPRAEEKSFLVTQYNPAMQAGVEAYRTLRTRLTKQQARSGLRSLVISSSSQGDGKTLTAFNLALCYAKMESFPLLIIDADLRSQGLSRLLGDPKSPGLSKILEGGCEYASAILATDFPGFYTLPAGASSSSPAELFSGPYWKEFMGWAAETFRLIIVDSPPALNIADFELVLGACDSAILVVRSRQTTMGNLTRVLAEVDPAKLLGVVFNGSEEAIKNYYPSK